MYSPKIREDLIPKIYQAAKAEKVRMTTLVNRILEKAVNGGGGFEGEKALSAGKESGLSEKNGGNVA
jgi:hypothetical protein